MSTKTVILDGDMKKNAVCYECHWTMLVHDQSGAYFCQFPDCKRYGLLTVIAIVEEEEGDNPKAEKDRITLTYDMSY